MRISDLSSDVCSSYLLTVALVGPLTEEVFTGPEGSLLAELDSRLGELQPGVVATWNGAAFDLPFIADRAALHGLPLGLRLQLDPTIASRHAPLPGHRGSYRARWYRHAPLDAYRVYRGAVGPALRPSSPLKSTPRQIGRASCRERVCPTV